MNTANVLLRPFSSYDWWHFWFWDWAVAAVVYLLNEKSLWRRNAFIPWDLSLHHTLCSSAVSMGDLFFFFCCITLICCWTSCLQNVMKGSGFMRLHPLSLLTDKGSCTCYNRSRRSICQTGKPDTGRHCAPFNKSKRWHCPSYSQGTCFNPHPIPISLSSLISKRRLCQNVSLWQFNLIVTIECLWVAKGTISSG